MRKTCMFCGGAPLTKEHIWPQRLKKLLPEPSRYTHERLGASHTSFLPTSAHWETQELRTDKRNGGPASRYLKVVCKPCNSGWMGGLQTRVQNHLDPLVSGEWPALDEQSATALAAWVTMLTMVIEEVDPRTQATSQEERDDFRATLNPLSNWTVWIGLSSYKATRAWNHRGLSVYRPEDFELMLDGPVPLAFPYQANTQVTATLTGEFVAVAYSSRAITSLPHDVLAGAPLRRIWPERDPMLNVRPAPIGPAEIRLVLDLITSSLRT